MRAIRASRALLGCLTLLVVSAAAPAARADSVTEWNAIAAAALQSRGGASPPGAGQGAQSTPHLAMVHGAVYDAVDAIAGGHEPYASSPAALPWYSQDAAVATAAHRVLTHQVVRGGLVVNDLGIPAGRIPTIDAAYQAAIAAIPPGAARDGGVATGVAAADAMLAERAADGRFGTLTFTAGVLPGAWRPTTGNVVDPGAWLQGVEPFLLRDPDRFRGRGPHPLHSRAYAEDFNEVKELGRTISSTRTGEQTRAANFWGAGNATATMASVARSVAATQGGSLADHARVLAQAYMNAADALIVTWRDKARYSFWRPITAIREAASDGNPATEPEPTWTSLIAAPPYPDHPSGLSAFGCAFTETWQDFYGRDAATYSGTSPASSHTYTSFSELCDEIVDARVASGIHFRFADDEAEKIGRRVAHWGDRHFP
jgi:hypothetical protein